MITNQNRKQIENKQKEKEINKINSKPQNAYSKKQKLLTYNERLFYKVMKEALKDQEIIILTQVVLYEIIQTNKENIDKYLYFNKIKSKSIDYVLTDNDFNILLCIELDDISHNRIDRVKRDEFINRIFRETGTKLLRVPVQQYYSVERIKKLIEENL